jgi:hypothetical protein
LRLFVEEGGIAAGGQKEAADPPKSPDSEDFQKGRKVKQVSSSGRKAGEEEVGEDDTKSKRGRPQKKHGPWWKAEGVIVPRANEFTIQVDEGKIYPTVGDLKLKWQQDPPSRYVYTRVRHWPDRAGKATGDAADSKDNCKGPFNWIWGCDEHKGKVDIIPKSCCMTLTLHDTCCA